MSDNRSSVVVVVGRDHLHIPLDEIISASHELWYEALDEVDVGEAAHELVGTRDADAVAFLVVDPVVEDTTFLQSNK